MKRMLPIGKYLTLKTRLNSLIIVDPGDDGTEEITEAGWLGTATDEGTEILKLGILAWTISCTDWLFSSSVGEASIFWAEISDWTVCDSLVTDSVCSLFDESDTTRSDSVVSKLLIMELVFCRMFLVVESIGSVTESGLIDVDNMNFSSWDETDVESWLSDGEIAVTCCKTVSVESWCDIEFSSCVELNRKSSDTRVSGSESPFF